MKCPLCNLEPFDDPTLKDIRIPAIHWRRCAICEEWKEITHRSSRWAKHPECANRARAKAHYYRQKEARGQA